MPHHAPVCDGKVHGLLLRVLLLLLSEAEPGEHTSFGDGLSQSCAHRGGVEWRGAQDLQGQAPPSPQSLFKRTADWSSLAWHTHTQLLLPLSEHTRQAKSRKKGNPAQKAQSRLHSGRVWASDRRLTRLLHRNHQGRSQGTLAKT